MAEINIPAGPVDESPYGAIRPVGNELVSDANGAALIQALDGLELGYHDRSVISWLSERDSATVATVCSWILRARAAETAGRIVLDEVDEMGISDDDWGRDLLWLEGDRITLNAHGPYYMDADEAQEWAAQFATMARALRARKAAKAGEGQ